MLPLYRPEIAADEVFRRHQARGARFANAATSDSSFPHDRNPQRPLRIGYVSPDFRVHPVGFFMESILRRHDRGQFSVTCYAEHAQDDRMTERLRPLVDRWRTTHRRSDEEVCRMIREDAIDILIDLAGHTSGNRLPVFARRPAPVQMTYLGYGTTTGLTTMDYRLTDAVANPPGETGRHTEELLRIPTGMLCFTPPADAPGVSMPPALQTGQITFGSFNNLSKLSEPTLDLWADLLRAIPNARLLLKNRSFADGTVRARFADNFAARNVATSRIELIGPTASITEHLSLYGRVDLALDPFPYNGATTTCESLWMGVPVITLRGSAFVGRMTASLLTTIGLNEFIAETAEQYIEIACRWANDVQKLSELRGNLRTILGRSPLCDEPAYVCQLEHIYQTEWQRWCAAISSA